MTSADTCQCVRLGTLLLVSIVCTNDELSEGNLSWTTLYAALVILVECFVTKVEIFSLGISVGYAT